MNFGEKLKELRGNKELTQPELAGKMGIEQSYLSKLENGKSLPSNDVLNRILDVFGLEIGDLLNDLDQSAQNHLRQIPDVANHFSEQKQRLINNRRHWLLLSALLLSFGVAFIYAGHTHLFFSNVIYQYRSSGIVLDGESKVIFSSPGSSLPRGSDKDTTNDFFNSISARVDEDFLLHKDFRGNLYNAKVDGGSRTYHLRGTREIDPWQSKFVVFIGVLMTLFGLIGMFLERKLSRHQ